MRLTVTRKSRFGFQAKGHEGWFNADRNAAPDFEPIQVGMTLEVEANGKYVRSFSIVSEGTAQAASVAPSNTVRTNSNDNRNEVITRLSVIKAVLTATSLFNETTRDRLIQKYVEYALTGNMPSVPNTENHLGDAPNAALSSLSTRLEGQVLRDAATTLGGNVSNSQVQVTETPRRRGRPNNGNA